jgi:hypothetical protein
MSDRYERILAEHELADDRQVGEPRHVHRADRLDHHAHVAEPGECGQTDAEQREREPRRNLVRLQRQCDHREYERQRRSRNDSRERAEPRRLGAGRDDESDDSAHQHHAFDAQVQYAGFFGDELAQRREYEWCAGGERQHEQLDNVIHQAGFTAVAGVCTTRSR